MSELELRLLVLQKLNEAFDAMQNLKTFYGRELNEHTRHLQIASTDLEKVAAYVYVYLIAGKQAKDV